jgi:hypothetical protein
MFVDLSLSQVMDVAQALSHLVGMPALERTLALPGPSTHTHEFLLELVATLTYNAPSRAPAVPKRVALALASAAQRIWWPTLSPDEVERRYIDDADTPGDWAAVGVEPDEIENHAITYVRRYRSACVIPSIVIHRFRPWVSSLPRFFLTLCHKQRELYPPHRPAPTPGKRPLLSRPDLLLVTYWLAEPPNRPQLTADS